MRPLEALEYVVGIYAILQGLASIAYLVFFHLTNTTVEVDFFKFTILGFLIFLVVLVEGLLICPYTYRRLFPRIFPGRRRGWAVVLLFVFLLILLYLDVIILFITPAL